MNGGCGGLERRARAASRRRARRASADQDQRGGASAACNDHTVLDLARALPRHAASSCASSSTWTSAPATTGEPDEVVPSRSCSTRSRARWPLDAAAPATIAAKSRALRARRRRGRDRLHLVGQRAVLRRLPRARGCRPTARSTPACSRRRAPTCARRCAPARATTSSRELLRERLDATARTATANCAARCAGASEPLRQDRDALHRPDEATDAHARRRRTTARRWSTWATRPSRTRTAVGRGARALPGGRRRARCASAGSQTEGPGVRHRDHRRRDGRQAHARADPVLSSDAARELPTSTIDMGERDEARHRVHGARARTRPASRWRRSRAPASPRSRSTTCARRCRTTS